MRAEPMSDGELASARPHPDPSAAMLERIERLTFGYFDRCMNPSNGLVPDSTKQDAPATVAGSGHALACYAVAAERGYVSRERAVARTLVILRFFRGSTQSEERDATGHRGFYYHFLEMASGRRAPGSELSTIDSAILFAGMLVAVAYFDRDTADEREIRRLGDALYRRADWAWACNGGDAVSMGWTPERGFLRYGWTGYNEALFLYVLALGSPTHPIDRRGYDAWTSTYRWKRIYGREHLFGGPLFIHQLSHAWIDFRGIRDEYMRGKGIDYFENSRRATYIQREYAIRNPRRFHGYGANAWGITASDGPGPVQRTVAGVPRRFWAYRARGVPFGPDDGTLSPWAVVASLPFAPELVIPALIELERTHPRITGELGYKCSYNETFMDRDDSGQGWLSQGYYAIDQGPVVLMIENHRSEFVWRLMRRCPYIIEGLRASGFDGGWLGADVDQLPLMG
jgi:hypothetical protein